MNHLKLLNFTILVALLSACGGGEGGAASTVPFIGSGVSAGQFDSVLLMPDEAFSGLLGDMEMSVTYDAVTKKFVGVVRNEAANARCNISVFLELDGSTTVNKTF